MASLKYPTIAFILFWSTCHFVIARTDKLKFSQGVYKEVFAENEIFYAPGSNLAVPLLSKSTDTSSLIFLSTKDRISKGVYGWLPCFCLVGVCNCCVDIQIRSLSTRDTSCISVSPSSDNGAAIDTGLILNNRTLIQQRISFDNSPPLCVPFPPFPAISLCVRLNEIIREERNVRACVNFELRITGTLNPLWTLRFTCVRLGFSGISFFRPPVTTPSPPGSSVEFPEQQQFQEPFFPSTQQESPQLFIIQQLMPLPPAQPTPHSTAPATSQVMQIPMHTPQLFVWPFGVILCQRMKLVFKRGSCAPHFDDPKPLCAPFPNFPLISGCIHFNRLRTDKGRIRGCAKMEIRLTGTDIIMYEVQFSCFRIGSDGIIINRPGINKNKVKPKPEPEKMPPNKVPNKNNCKPDKE